MNIMKDLLIILWKLIPKFTKIATLMSLKKNMMLEQGGKLKVYRKYYEIYREENDNEDTRS